MILIGTEGCMLCIVVYDVLFYMPVPKKKINFMQI